MGKTVVVSGGTNGMGRATALARLARGDAVTVIGSDRARGEALVASAGNPNLTFLHADMSSIAETERVVAEIAGQHDRVDALLLFANRVSPRRRETVDGLEYTFALYYLSRYLLGHRLRPLLDASPQPVIVNVAGTGTIKGGIHWADPQLTSTYGQVKAQLQAGRANDLLGAAHSGKARYVLYHPGFTRSGTDSYPNRAVAAVITILGRLFARTVTESAAPIVDWVDNPPSPQLTAVDRGKILATSFPTLDPADASRLADYTSDLVNTKRPV